jgi:hypothetical protein
MNTSRPKATLMLMAAVLSTGVSLAVYRAVSVQAQSQARSEPAVPLPVIVRTEPSRPPVGLPQDSHLDKTPPRRTTGLDLVKMGWTYNCTDCHKLLPAKWHYDRPMVEHLEIQLDHGNNRFCLNCHHPTNRNVFVDYDGSEIREADVVLLCAKCHGPTYRDWEAGVHGRRNGYWMKGKGEQTRLRCIECHDPHRPVFKAVKPLAAPRYPARAPQPTKPGVSASVH